MPRRLRLSHVRKCEVRLGQISTGYDWLGQEKSW
jgi:hypothetical protein